MTDRTTNETTITILTRAKLSWRIFLFPSLQVGVIGVGIWAESPAMQWIGFAFLLLFIVVLAVAWGERNTRLTIDEARQRLDEIERNERT